MEKSVIARVLVNTGLAVSVSSAICFSLYWAFRPDYFAEPLALLLPIAMPSLIAPVLTFAMARVQEELRHQKHELELVRERNREFLGNLSHELRNPLNAIIGFSDMIKSEVVGPVNPKYADYAAHINSSGLHLQSLVDDLMDLSKIEAGRVELAPEPVDLPPLLSVIAQSCGPLSDKRNGCIDIDNIAPGTSVFADRRALRQILTNLITNAIKYSRDEGVVSIACRPTRTGMEIDIRDRGFGMAPEDVELALSRFGRVRRHRREQGVGLGLPIVKGLVELHGGTLSIASQPNEGTTVTAYFPNR